MALNDRIAALAEECKAWRIETKRGAYDKLVKKMTLCCKVGELELKCLRAQMDVANKLDQTEALAHATATVQAMLSGDGKQYGGGN